MKNQPTDMRRNPMVGRDMRWLSGKNGPAKKRALGDQKGQVIVELALMMPFLAAILLAVVIIYEYGARNVDALEILRQEMRESMNDSAAGPFRAGTERQTIRVDIPGKMKQVFNAPFLDHELHINYYEGSYHGSDLTKYHNRGRRIREINL